MHARSHTPRTVALFAAAFVASLVLAPALTAAPGTAANELSATEKAAGFELLFDGLTLEGWEGNPDFWTVERGAIVGRTTKENPTKGNTFLIYRPGLLTDFELRVSWKIEGGNSGIQFRSRDLGNWVVGGYQADLDASGKFTGILYDEKGRGILAKRNEKVLVTSEGKKVVVAHLAGEETIRAAIDADGWNETVVTAWGHHIVQTINGVTTMELYDRDKEKRVTSGILALQLHAGPPMTVRFRSIKLKRYASDRPEALFDGRSLTGWMLHEGLPGGEVAGKWTVEDGSIVGRQHPPGKGGFLTTLREYQDFELEFETKIEWPFDSGVFLRVGPHGKSHQVTLDYRENGTVGAIYCPWTQGFVHKGDGEGMRKFKKDAWNQAKIRIEGEPARIRFWLNGDLITDFQHTEKSTAGVPGKGTICLQVHPGGKGYDEAYAAFRSLSVRDLSVGRSEE